MKKAEPSLDEIFQSINMDCEALVKDCFASIGLSKTDYNDDFDCVARRERKEEINAVQMAL